MKIYNIIMLLAIIIITNGCSKMLNPVGSSEFSCANNDNGVCAGVEDVYSNRHDIASYKKELKNEMPEKDTFIEETCGIHKMLDDEAAYKDCVKSAEKAYKQSQTGVSAETFRENTISLEMKHVVRAKEGIPLRQPETVTRIWFAPYENDMGDLVYSHFVYVVQDRPNWLFVPEDEAELLRSGSNSMIIGGGR
jgi:type IV conjugative transfer system lipoprotein TraV